MPRLPYGAQQLSMCVQRDRVPALLCSDYYADRFITNSIYDVFRTPLNYVSAASGQQFTKNGLPPLCFGNGNLADRDICGRSVDCPQITFCRAIAAVGNAAQQL